MNELAIITGSHAVGSAVSGIVVPTLIADAGDQAARRFLEFFAATIRNKNTRMAYYRAVLQFFAWCDRHQLGQLVDIEPLHVAAYIEALQQHFAKPAQNQHSCHQPQTDQRCLSSVSVPNRVPSFVQP